MLEYLHQINVLRLKANVHMYTFLLKQYDECIVSLQCILQKLNSFVCSLCVPYSKLT